MSDITEQVVSEEVHRSCAHPRRTLKDGSYIYTRCNSQDYDVCPACASIHARRVKAIIEDGFTDENGNPWENVSWWFLTLTAPRMRYSDGRIKPRTMVQWNDASGTLLNRTLDNLASRISAPVAYIRMAEYQQRGSIHYHIILRVHSTDIDRISENLHRCHTDTAGGYTWGTRYDVKQLTQEDLGTTGDYTSKSVVDDLARLGGYVSKTLGRTTVLPASQRENHLALEAQARKLGMSEKKIKGLGYGGQVFRQSRDWGTLSKKSLAEQEKAYAIERASETSDRIDYRARRYEENISEWGKILSEYRHTGTYQSNRIDPLAAQEDRGCGSVSLDHSIPAEWLTAAQVEDMMTEIRMNRGQSQTR